MPENQGAGVGCEVGFIRRQFGANGTQVMEFAVVGKWRDIAARYREGERRSLTKQSKEDQFIGVDEVLDPVARQQAGRS